MQSGFACPQCSKRLATKEARAMHLRKRHGIKSLGRVQFARWAAIGVVGLLVVGAGTALMSSYQPPHRGGWNLEGQPSLGNESAAVQLVLFEDPNCPFCKRFHDETLSLLVARYVDTGRVQLIFKQFSGGNSWTTEGSVAQECAFLQGNDAFWAFTDRFYDQQTGISRGNIRSIVVGWAQDLMLDVEAFTRCYDNQETLGEVHADWTDGRALGARGTPTFFVRDAQTGQAELISGAQPYAVFETALEAALARAA